MFWSSKEDKLEADTSLSTTFVPQEHMHMMPATLAERTWTTWHFLALFLVICSSLPVILIGLTMIDIGLTSWQAILAILAAAVIFIVPILCGVIDPVLKTGLTTFLTVRAAVGWKVSLAFSVARFVFGMLVGSVLLWSNVVFVKQGFMQGSAGFQSIQDVIQNGWGFTVQDAISLAFVWVVTLLIGSFGLRGVTWSVIFSAAVVPLYYLIILLLGFLGAQKHRTFGPIFATDQPYNRTNPFVVFTNTSSGDQQSESYQFAYADFIQVFLVSIGLMVALSLPFLVSIADYGRIAVSGARVRIVSGVSIPILLCLFSLIGMALTSFLYASYPNLYQVPVTDLPLIFKQDSTALSNGAFVLVFSLVITLSTVVTNVALNVIPMGMALMTLFTQLHSTAAYVLSIVSVLFPVPFIIWSAQWQDSQMAQFQPQTSQNDTSLIYAIPPVSILQLFRSISPIMLPVLAILLAHTIVPHYNSQTSKWHAPFLVCRSNKDISALYGKKWRYPIHNGFGWKALVALAFGFVIQSLVVAVDWYQFAKGGSRNYAPSSLNFQWNSSFISMIYTNGSNSTLNPHNLTFNQDQISALEAAWTFQRVGWLFTLLLTMATYVFLKVALKEPDQDKQADDMVFGGSTTASDVTEMHTRPSSDNIMGAHASEEKMKIEPEANALGI